MSQPSADHGFDAFRLARRSLIPGTLLALLSAGLYGANIPAARVASQAGMRGADLIAYRAMILVPLLFLIARIAGVSLRLSPAQLWPSLRLGLAASLTATFYLSALDHLAVPMAVVIFYTFPLFVMLLSNRIARRRLSLTQIGVFIIAFCGLVLAVGPSLSGLAPLGVLFALFGALACAALFLVAGDVENAPLRSFFWTQVIAAPVALGFATLNGGLVPLSTFAKAPIAIAIAMGAYAVAFVLQLMASARISPGRTSLLFLFEPVMAILVAGLVLNEQISWLQIAGVGLILAGLAAEILLGAREPGNAPDA